MSIAVKLAIRKPDGADGWYAIQRFWSSAPFSDAAIEGTADDMRGIAKAIRARGEFSARRCSVRVAGDEVRFRNPLNSAEDGVTNLACADELAAEIERELGA